MGYSDGSSLILARYHNELQSSTLDMDNKSAIYVYPNPTHSWVNITLSDVADGPVSVVLKNSFGAMVHVLSTTQLQENTVQATFPENLPPDTYYLVVGHKQYHFTKKVVVH